MENKKRNNDKFIKDGIILLNKSKDISSFNAINKLKWLLNINKVGHAGTLDPMAEGLLIVMTNNGTKFSNNLMKKDKEYYVEMELGFETDTYDKEGEIIKKYENEINFEYEKIKENVYSFLGEIKQIPPMYSAIKIKGEKLYDLARKGIEVDREKRNVKINYINNLEYDNDKKLISFTVGVSSGTYIRSLVKDIGDKLGVYATMTKLVRTKIDRFSLENTVSLEKIIEYFENDENRNNEKIEKILYFEEIENIFEYDKIKIDENEYKNLKNGMTVLINKNRINNAKTNEEYSVYNEKNEFLGIVKIIKINNDKIYLKRDKYFK